MKSEEAFRKGALVRRRVESFHRRLKLFRDVGVDALARLGCRLMDLAVQLG